MNTTPPHLATIPVSVVRDALQFAAKDGALACLHLDMRRGELVALDGRTMYVDTIPAHSNFPLSWWKIMESATQSAPHPVDDLISMLEPEVRKRIIRFAPERAESGMPLRFHKSTSTVYAMPMLL